MDDLSDLIERSVDAIHHQNTGRPVKCLMCGVTFIGPTAAIDYFRHQSHQHTHPSRAR